MNQEKLNCTICRDDGSKETCTCTPIEEPTEEKREFTQEDFTKHTCKLDLFSSLICDLGTKCCTVKHFKDTCEEEWEEGLIKVIYTKCGNLEITGEIKVDGIVEPIFDYIRSLIAEKEATARREERKRIIEIVEKSKEENLSHACKATNCSDPICGHSRCIDWMFTDLLLALKTN